MVKKLSAILLSFIILATFSISAYAGQTEAIGTTPPAVNAGSQQQNPTGGAIKGTASSKSAITSESSITSESAVTNENAVTSKSAISAKKSDFNTIFYNLLENGRAIDNGQFIMNITSPDKDKDSTYKKTYILSGDSAYNDVVITIAKYNSESKKYELMKNTDGESSWDIGDYRVFIKNITLDMGVNKIKIVSYRTSQKQDADEKDLQVNSFTIERLNESIAERAVNATVNLGKDIKEGVKSTIELLTGGKSK